MERERQTHEELVFRGEFSFSHAPTCTHAGGLLVAISPTRNEREYRRYDFRQAFALSSQQRSRGLASR